MSGKIGITGSSGVLGTLLKEKLIGLKQEISEFTGNICDCMAVSQWVNSCDFDSIIHLAALVPVVTVNKNVARAFQVNVAGTINLLSSIQESGQKPWFFYASSSHVYKSKKEKLSETDPIDPITIYGKSKYLAEKACMEYYLNEEDAFDVCCGRIFSFYHDSQKEPFLYPTIKRRLREEDLSKPFFLVGAEAKRDFLNAEEITDIILQLKEKKATGIVNIGSGKATKIKDFVQSFSSQLLHFDTDSSDANHLVADISKLESILGDYTNE